MPRDVPEEQRSGVRRDRRRNGRRDGLRATPPEAAGRPAATGGAAGRRARSLSRSRTARTAGRLLSGRPCFCQTANSGVACSFSWNSRNAAIARQSAFWTTTRRPFAVGTMRSAMRLETTAFGRSGTASSGRGPRRSRRPSSPSLRPACPARRRGRFCHRRRPAASPRRCPARGPPRGPCGRSPRPRNGSRRASRPRRSSPTTRAGRRKSPSSSSDGAWKAARKSFQRCSGGSTVAILVSPSFSSASPSRPARRTAGLTNARPARTPHDAGG